MTQITYGDYRRGLRYVPVYLEDKLVGTIELLSDNMWQYWPKGSRAEGGDKFPTLALCKASLEGEE